MSYQSAQALLDNKKQLKTLGIKRKVVKDQIKLFEQNMAAKRKKGKRV